VDGGLVHGEVTPVGDVLFGDAVRDGTILELLIRAGEVGTLLVGGVDEEVVGV